MVTRSLANFTSLDAKAIACTSNDGQVITTPNMTFVPEPHVDEEDIRARADGRFGVADCFQWPQLYADRFNWTVCIPRKESHPLPKPLSWAWYTPILEDLCQSSSVAPGRGFLKQEKFSGLSSLYDKAKNRHQAWRAN
jgi:hypothetical protein